MKQKIRNPFIHLAGYQCFGCSPFNIFGLRMEFELENDIVVCKWLPQKHFQGWFNLLHGGIQTSLIDEIACWAVFIKSGRAAVTYEITVKFSHPVYIEDNIPITIKAKLQEIKKNIAFVEANIFDSSNKLCTTALCKYYVYSEQVSKDKFHFPNKEEFFHD